MGVALKRTISLPEDLAIETEATAREEGKSVSAFIQDALRAALREKRKREFSSMQSYWSTKAREAGILSEDDLDRLAK